MTWSPTDWNTVDEKNTIALLRVAAAGRRIYMAEDCGDLVYRFDNIDSDGDNDIPDGTAWVDEVRQLILDGLLEQVGHRRPDAVITAAGREYLAEVNR